MRIALGSDDEAPVVEVLAEEIARLGHLVVRVAEHQEWPEVGLEVGAAVACGRADMGVVCCWTGTGVAIAANKVSGIRAALCTDVATAAGARRWNDANVLALSLRLTSSEVAREVLQAFVGTSVDPAETPVIARVEYRVTGTMCAMPASGVVRVEHPSLEE